MVVPSLGADILLEIERTAAESCELDARLRYLSIMPARAMPEEFKAIRPDQSPHG